MPELIRYDQIASYEEYLDETPAKEPGQKPTLNCGGLKLKLVQPRSITEAQTQRGMHPHPYIKQELVICFSKRDRREIRLCHIARQHLDHIFGVHDNETSLFGRPDVQGRGTGAEGPDGHDRCHGCRGICRHERRAAL